MLVGPASNLTYRSTGLLAPRPPHHCVFCGAERWLVPGHLDSLQRSQRFSDLLALWRGRLAGASGIAARFVFVSRDGVAGWRRCSGTRETLL